MTKNNAPLILRMLQKITTKTLYKAISILLYPCCKVTVVDAVATCGDGNIDIALTLSESVNFLGKGKFIFVAASGQVVGVGEFSNGDTITFSSSISNDSTYSVSGFLLLPTNNSGDIGVYMSIPTFTLVVPAC